MSIQAILFDLDNTLYPASCGLVPHVEQRIARFVMEHMQVNEATALEMCQSYYVTYGTTLQGLQTHFGVAEPEAFVNYIHDIAVEEFITPNPKLTEMLAELPVRKIIFTNSVHDYAERVLEHMGIRDQFERIFDVRYFKLVGKPEPANYTHILDWLELSGEEVMMIEDSAVNLLPAKALGMTTILVDETLANPAGADYHVHNIIPALEIARQLLAPAMSSVVTTS
ncbi:MAG: pyrimidine 5'-nucleotidase [Herpetosiphonaceae bacterium]|nr:pyrimidine 5'-nucleotidase [Herpetosiphonaceae bacterium]